jgi:hypothetical protein
MRRFTPKECALIKQEYAAYVPVPAIARKLNRSQGTIRYKVFYLGLRRSPYVLKAMPRAPEHLKARVKEVPPSKWLKQYRAWQNQQRQERLRQSQEQVQAHQARLAIKCAEIDARDLTRDKKIIAKRALGMTLEAVGKQHSLSKQRVHQLVKSIA